MKKRGKTSARRRRKLASGPGLALALRQRKSYVRESRKRYSRQDRHNRSWQKEE